MSPDIEQSTVMRLWATIEEWKLIADQTVDDIGDWRDADQSDLVFRYWAGESRIPPREPEPPRDFRGKTLFIVSCITTHYPKHDPTPFQDIYAAITAWHEDRNASRIPPQPVLFATLDRAVQTLQAIESDLWLRSQTAERRPPRTKWLAEAMLTVQDKPEWSDAQIAKTVGVSKSTLSRSKTYRVAAHMARQGKQVRRRGFIKREPHTGLTDVEAIDDPDGQDEA